MGKCALKVGGNVASNCALAVDIIFIRYMLFIVL